MKCERCGKDNTQVLISKSIDPYIREMFGEEIEITLCDECYSDRVMSV